MSSIHQLNAEVGRVLAPSGGTAPERRRAVALTAQLNTSLAGVETDLIRSTDAGSNGETLALRGATELRTAMTALADYAEDRTPSRLQELRNDALVAVSDWDAGARIVWSMAGRPPPLP